MKISILRSKTSIAFVHIFGYAFTLPPKQVIFVCCVAFGAQLSISFHRHKQINLYIFCIIFDVLLSFKMAEANNQELTAAYLFGDIFIYHSSEKKANVF